MGIFEKIFGKREPVRAGGYDVFRLLDGYTPSFRTWSGSIFESDLIRAALDAHGRHAAKLQPNVVGAAQRGLQSRLAVQPNEFQTWPQFLYRLAVTLYAKNTAFLVPVLGPCRMFTPLLVSFPSAAPAIISAVGSVRALGSSERGTVGAGELAAPGSGVSGAGVSTLVGSVSSGVGLGVAVGAGW